MSNRSAFPTLDQLVAQIDPRSSWTVYLIAAGALLSIGLALTKPLASNESRLPARLVFMLAHVSSALVLFDLAQIYLGRIALFERLLPLALIVLVRVMAAFLFAIFNLLVRHAPLN